MAYQKWLIYPPGQNRPLGLRFDFELQSGHLGGVQIDYDNINFVITEYLGIKLGRKKRISGNKIRFKIMLSSQKFKNALKRLDEDGYIINDTKSLGRVMR